MEFTAALFLQIYKLSPTIYLLIPNTLNSNRLHTFRDIFSKGRVSIDIQ
nr:MAG TPA: hypothetical protein [Caudoviricetes sp.]